MLEREAKSDDRVNGSNGNNGGSGNNGGNGSGGESNSGNGTTANGRDSLERAGDAHADRGAAGRAQMSRRRVQPGDANQLNPLGEKIFLDRYALKDMDRANIAVGDVVVVCVNTETGQREIGTVTARSHDSVSVALSDGEVIERAVEHVDRPLETHPDDMQARVAWGVAQIESEDVREEWESRFKWLLSGWKFVPGGRILTAAGTDQDLTYYNCYVIPSPHDSREGIVETLSHMTEIMSRGGGVGINLTSLRPRYAYVTGVNGRSSGSVSWGSLYSFVTGLIEQGGSRRGALMLILNVWHPDVQEFINAKREMGRITNANISVGITDDFMQAVENDADWDLVFPDTRHEAYDTEWTGDLGAWVDAGRPVVTYRTVRARDLWNSIIESAWASAEPGIWFSERSNKMSNSHYFAPLVCTNPCITGDTRIATDRGLIRAAELCRDGADVGVVLDPRLGGERASAQASHVFRTGRKPVMRLRFREGYTLRATPDHKLYTPHGWRTVADMRSGDQVCIQARKGGFGTEGDLESGRTLGWLLGDRAQPPVTGVLSAFGSDASYEAVSGADVAGVGNGSAAGSGMAVGHVARAGLVAGAPHAGAVGRAGEGNVATATALAPSTALASAVPNGSVPGNSVTERSESGYAVHSRGGETPNEGRRRVPEVVFQGTEAMRRGFLQALFSTAGQIREEPTPHLVLVCRARRFMEEIQLLLLGFGVFTEIRPARSAGSGAEQWELTVPTSDLATFTAEVGLLLPDLERRLESHLPNLPHRSVRQFVASIESVEEAGTEDVFDLTEPLTHSFVAAGIVVHNCGEQPLPSWGVCNLGAINLARFERDGDVDWESLRKTVHYAVRFLDNVIDTTPYFFRENEDQQKKERRVGLGTMGLAELMIRCGVGYGGGEGTQFIDRLYGFIAAQAYLASADNAAEKGSFPMFEAEAYLDSGFMQSMPENVRGAIREKGARNVTLLTQAPTGTTGTMVGTSTGIEPFYSWTYYRKSRLGMHEEQVGVYEDWQQAHPGEPLPDYFVTAMDLMPEEHIRVQAAVQRWVDSSISKTCNVPNNYTVSETRELYELMYRLGCKGGTVYRDGSRDEQVLSLKKDSGETAKDGEKRIKSRPRQMIGTTYRTVTPLGKAYVTVNRNATGEPFEVFVNLGKAGSDLTADAEALGRLISLILRLPSSLDPTERLAKVIDELDGIGGSRTVGFGAKRVRSLPDGIAHALREDIDDVAIEAEGDQPSLFEAVPGADLCPVCGHASFVREEGCQKCYSCGHSEC